MCCDGSRSQAEVDSLLVDDEQTMKECMARRMHPASTSVLQRAALENDSGWVTVPLSVETEMSMDVKPAPSASAHAELPLSPNGVSLLPGRPYTDVLIRNLLPESVYRFRIRFANAREFCAWSKPSYPCTVFGDWPDPISKPPVVISRTPFTLFLNWHEPEVNDCLVLALVVLKVVI